MVTTRHLAWEGAFNARDLGGLPTTDGGTTLPGAVVRSDAPDDLTAAGWAGLWAHGVRTVLDLREPDEIPAERVAPDWVTVVRVPLDDRGDTAFWQYCADNGLSSGTPLYYGPFLRRKADRCVAAIEAIADAPPGGVLVHCASGRDRTGLISLLLLALAGVEAAAIVADYELSEERLRPAFAALGWRDQGPLIRELLARRNTSAEAEILSLLETLDIEAVLRAAGLGETRLAAVRARLLGERAE
ncbi:tyrosine-protein phosphatase [Streptomyces triticirhizae]|uniref:Tyrosine-protein phosphatase n=1 Tax=Streptomyces triticirhizae TaxID=2483353 RepID=A0A3M2L6Y3_9ACTN|nr:tyrosine-protein phosphatase [Streptomyces triticirhizae]RMI33094.1 tyrosine-protein phosphatase [Streptomyces triticirhizae]